VQAHQWLSLHVFDLHRRGEEVLLPFGQAIQQEQSTLFLFDSPRNPLTMSESALPFKNGITRPAL